MTMRLALLLIATVVISQLAVGGDETPDHRCGPTGGGDNRLCDPGRCCSCDCYCGSGSEYCGVDYPCGFVCLFDPNTTTSVPDHKKSYSSVDDFGTGGERVNCAAVNRVNMSMGWIQEHGPTVFCGRKPTAVAESINGTMASTSHACGKCLKVTRSETGTQTTVRLLDDDCSRKGPMLGNAIFQELDTDGKGAAQGYLTVAYQSLPCDED